jgi:hypothetical protein
MNAKYDTSQTLSLRRSVWFLLFLSGFFGGGVLTHLKAAGEAPPIEDWVERQVWFANLAASMPGGVNLIISPGIEEQEAGWESFSLRESHSEGSGFDPSVSPLVGIFRVSKDRGMIEWMEPVAGEWESLSAFFRSRSSGVAPASSGKPDSMSGKEVPTRESTTLSGKGHPRQLSGDLDGDGRTDFIRWEPVGATGGDEFLYLEVTGGDGEILWTGPREKSLENAYIFFNSHIGSSLPQLLIDYDGDGHLELLAPEPQSDVSATFYRRIKWKDGSFRPLSSSALMWEDESKPLLTWKEGDVSFGTWVSQFGDVTDDGRVQAGITRYLENGEWRGGIALIRFTAAGATIEDWIHPLSENPPAMRSTEDRAASEPPAVDATRFPLQGSISVAYSEKAFSLLQSKGTKLTANLIIDAYGPVYMEEEGIASLGLNFAPGESVRFNGVPFQNPEYQIRPDRRYKLTVMILPEREEGEEVLFEIYASTGEVDWVTTEIQGRNLLFHCKHRTEEGDPPMIHLPVSPAGGDATGGAGSGLYDPFGDADPDQFFLK